MPIVNYCKKCKVETPIGETCPHCAGKLAKTGEQLSFGVVRMPMRDWFAWNHLLRVGLPVILLVMIIAITVEAITGSKAGVIVLFADGFFWTMLGAFGAMLLFTLVLFVLQGRERTHFILDRQGVWARTYLRDPSDIQLYARFLTPQSVDLLEDDARPAIEGLTLIRRVHLPWAEIKRVRIWHQGYTLLFFKPTFWQAIAVSCPIEDLPEAEEFIRKKLKRFKKVKVQPVPKTPKKK